MAVGEGGEDKDKDKELEKEDDEGPTAAGNKTEKAESGGIAPIVPEKGTTEASGGEKGEEKEPTVATKRRRRRGVSGAAGPHILNNHHPLHHTTLSGMEEGQMTTVVGTRQLVDVEKRTPRVDHNKNRAGGVGQQSGKGPQVSRPTSTPSTRSPDVEPHP